MNSLGITLLLVRCRVHLQADIGEQLNHDDCNALHLKEALVLDVSSAIDELGRYVLFELES